MSTTPQGTILQNQQPIRFDWDSRWLRGEEYAHILQNMDRYREAYGLKFFDQKTHPESIYTEPESNQKLLFVFRTSLTINVYRWHDLLREGADDRI
jgi:hypothetical protein